MRCDICNRIKYNSDAIGLITIRIAVYDVLDGMSSVINILIKLSILVLFLDALTIVFNGIGLKSYNLCDIEYNSNITRLINNLSINTINNDAALVVNIEFCLAAILFVMQVMDGSLLVIRVSIKFDTNMVAIARLKTNLVVQSLNGAVNCHKQVIHHVCGVFYSLFCKILYLFNL